MKTNDTICLIALMVFMTQRISAADLNIAIYRIQEESARVTKKDAPAPEQEEFQFLDWTIGMSSDPTLIIDGIARKRASASLLYAKAYMMSKEPSVLIDDQVDIRLDTVTGRLFPQKYGTRIVVTYAKTVDNPDDPAMPFTEVGYEVEDLRFPKDDLKKIEKDQEGKKVVVATAEQVHEAQKFTVKKVGVCSLGNPLNHIAITGNGSFVYLRMAVPVGKAIKIGPPQP